MRWVVWFTALASFLFWLCQVVRYFDNKSTVPDGVFWGVSAFTGVMIYFAVTVGPSMYLVRRARKTLTH